MSGNSSGGNARDQRQRGNAAQLLEKYKSLARDSQLAGDRVQTEYWLQFADHYFRVLGESRAKYDEQRRARGENIDDDYDDDGEGYDGDDDGDEPSQQPQQQQQREQPRRQQEGDRYERPAERHDRPERQDRQQQQQPRNDRYERQDRPERLAERQAERKERPVRQERPDRAERPERPERQAERQERPPIQQQPRAERVERAPRADAAERPERAPRADRPRIRRDREVESDGGGERIAFDVIPPAIGASAPPEVPANDVAEEAPAPRRRVRRARPDGEADVAPAA